MGEVVKALILPSGWIFLCLVFGVLLLINKRRRRWGLYVLGIAAVIYIVLGFRPTAALLIEPLESAYPPISSSQGLEDVETIVVLTGYGEENHDLPLRGSINPASAFRIMEAVRLCTILVKPEIIITGSEGIPEVMGRRLKGLGIERDRIKMERRSRNTYESASNILERIGDKRFILVTSAKHMPRAVGVFEKMGMKPIPAPTEYMSRKDRSVARYIPSAKNFSFAEEAVHEYIGILWYRMRNRL